MVHKEHHQYIRENEVNFLEVHKGDRIIMHVVHTYENDNLTSAHASGQFKGKTYSKAHKWFIDNGYVHMDGRTVDGKFVPNRR